MRPLPVSGQIWGHLDPCRHVIISAWRVHVVGILICKCLLNLIITMEREVHVPAFVSVWMILEVFPCPYCPMANRTRIILDATRKANVKNVNVTTRMMICSAREVEARLEVEVEVPIRVGQRRRRILPQILLQFLPLPPHLPLRSEWKIWNSMSLRHIFDPITIPTSTLMLMSPPSVVMMTMTTPLSEVQMEWRNWESVLPHGAVLTCQHLKRKRTTIPIPIEIHQPWLIHPVYPAESNLHNGVRSHCKITKVIARRTMTRLT
mmetsp:Transcript_9435/g.13647  ORF Transcript_9435/g.13647 Transcript_9435/m.13647 type:complete len:263 (+) Transcript_9435:247-1035(+)